MDGQIARVICAEFVAVSLLRAGQISIGASFLIHQIHHLLRNVDILVQSVGADHHMFDLVRMVMDPFQQHTGAMRNVEDMHLRCFPARTACGQICDIYIHEM